MKKFTTEVKRRVMACVDNEEDNTTTEAPNPRKPNHNSPPHDGGRGTGGGGGPTIAQRASTARQKPSPLHRPSPPQVSTPLPPAPLTYTSSSESYRQHSSDPSLEIISYRDSVTTPDDDSGFEPPRGRRVIHFAKGKFLHHSFFPYIYTYICVFKHRSRLFIIVFMS